MLENYHWKRKNIQEPVFPTKQMHDFTQSNRIHVVSHLQTTFLPFPLPLFFHRSIRWDLNLAADFNTTNSSQIDKDPGVNMTLLLR